MPDDRDPSVPFDDEEIEVFPLEWRACAAIGWDGRPVVRRVWIEDARGRHLRGLDAILADARAVIEEEIARRRR